MFALLIICFFAAVLAPWVHRRVPKYAGALLALVPAAVFVWLIRQLPTVAHGHSLEQSFQWVEGLGLEFALRLDGRPGTYRGQLIADSGGMPKADSMPPHGRGWRAG